MAGHLPDCGRLGYLNALARQRGVRRTWGKQGGIEVSSLVLEPAARNMLRRGIDPFEVPAAYTWARRLSELAEFKGVDEMSLVRLAPLGAEVREDTERPLGEALRATLSERRARRLLASEREDIVPQLARAVRIARRRVGVADLIATALFWGDQRRRHLAVQFFRPESAGDASAS